MLEASMYSDNAFVTLTYDHQNLPLGSCGMPTLIPKHLQDWLKRLRNTTAPLRLRFYAVGEYGDETWRPHYHAALFNYPSCLYGRSRYSERRTSCCLPCDRVRESWGLGLVDVGSLTVHSAQYVAGYVTKKLTDKRDVRLSGRHPEFARMSLRPGIGAPATESVARVVADLNLVEMQGDVPSSLRHGGRIMPFGRYLHHRLREEVTGDKKKAQGSSAPAIGEDAYLDKMRQLQIEAKEAGKSLKAYVLEKFDVKVGQMETRSKIFKQRKSL